jgi:(p)ppGpp synthase/HD superfamily hydrolase
MIGPMDLVLRAIGFATRKHLGQWRKDGATPYAAHPIRVMLTVLREFGETDPETLAAAALHDTIEDSTTDFDEVAGEFGGVVASYVAVLTKDKRLPQERREDAYFEGLARAPLAAKLCKVADTLDNLRDSPAGGSRDSALAKAARLLGIFRGTAGLERALAVLEREMSAAGSAP